MSLLARQNCVVCPTNRSAICEPGCTANEICILVANSCTQCGSPTCQRIDGSSSSSKPNSGAIAGGVVAALIALLLGVGYLWYRRRQALALAARKRATVEVKSDVVASAEAVLNRPDPLEKPPSLVVTHEDDKSSGYNPENSSAIRMNALPSKQPENPFSDHASIATASDRATNAIPIGLLDPSSASAFAGPPSASSSSTSSPGTISTSFTAASPPRGPIRPARAGPEIDMRLDLARPVSEAPSVLLPPTVPYAQSSRSGVSSRSSMISTSSSFLNEAPQIVTPKQANFRQVLGVQRAEVVKLGPTPPSPSNNSHLSVAAAKKSPLSQAPVATGDNPFTDSSNPISSVSTTGTDGSPSRPTSAMSATESIANISTVQKVQLVQPGVPRVAEARALLALPPSSPSPISHQQSQVSHSPPSSAASTPRAADFRSAGQLSPRGGEFRTPGQLSPPAQGVPRSFDDMMDHRMSGSSLALTNRTSTTDSILEAFPFVPPSPISLAHANSGNATPSSSGMRSFKEQQIAAMEYAKAHNLEHDRDSTSTGGETPKAGRMTLGMSTISSTSSGLANYAFQVEGGIPLPGLAKERDDRERTSLDTVQLQSDLAKFPLPGDSPTTLKGL